MTTPQTATSSEHEAPPTVPSRCPHCFSRSFRDLDRFRGPGTPAEGSWRVVECADCQLWFTHPRPDLSDTRTLERYYPASYLAYQPNGKRRRWHTSLRERLDAWLLTAYRGYPSVETERRWGSVAFWLAPLMGRCLDERIVPPHGGRRLLDVGCGGGEYLARMRRLGWDVLGVDPSPHAREAAAKLDIEVLTARLPDVNLGRRQFDVVTAWQVLEHVQRPRHVLASIRELLAPGGRLVLTVPNQESWAARRFGHHWVGLDLPRHLTHFGTASLTRMLTAEGFATVHVCTLGRSGWVRHAARRSGRWSDHVFRARWPSSLASGLASYAGRGETLFAVAEVTP